MRAIAGGLGDEYDDTSAVAGRLPRCKKGDGVLTISGGSRLVVELRIRSNGLERVPRSG